MSEIDDAIDALVDASDQLWLSEDDPRIDDPLNTDDPIGDAEKYLEEKKRELRKLFENQQPERICRWSAPWTKDGDYVYITECEKDFGEPSSPDDDPADEGFIYCPNCGGKTKLVSPKEGQKMWDSRPEDHQSFGWKETFNVYYWMYNNWPYSIDHKPHPDAELKTVKIYLSQVHVLHNKRYCTLYVGPITAIELLVDAPETVMRELAETCPTCGKKNAVITLETDYGLVTRRCLYCKFYVEGFSKLPEDSHE